MAGCLAAGQTAAKAHYFAVFCLTVLVTWLLKDYAEDALKRIPQLKTCFSAQADGSPGACTGKGAVLRVSFGNFLFFAAHFLLLIGCRRRTDARRFLHTGCLTLQTLAWAGVIVACFFMPNGVFYVWGQVSRVLGAIFLVLQIVLALDFIFAVNEWLVDREGCHCVLAGGSALLLLGGFAFAGLAFHYYAPHADCGLNIFFITFSIVLGLAAAALAVSPARIQSAGLLTAGMVTAYGVYLLWAALGSQPRDGRCVAKGDAGQDRALEITGFVLALVSVTLATFFASTEASSFNAGGGKAEGSLDYPPDFFHCVYMLASAYVGMLFLGWSLQNVPGKLTVDSGWISCWFHIASQWFSFLLYAWILLAPRILRGRDFGLASA